eukprot:1839573-Amphidinium_carterae.1
MGSTKNSAAMGRAELSVCLEGVKAERSTDEVLVLSATDTDCAMTEEGPDKASQVVALSPPLLPTNRRALVQSSYMQPRGCKVAQLVTEFAYRVWISCGDLPPVDEKRRAIAPHTSIPMGALRGAEDCVTRKYEGGAYRTPADWHMLAIRLSFSHGCYPLSTSLAGRLCALKKELHEKEKIQRLSMPAHVEHVVKRKAVLLFSELLKECG